MIAGCTESWPYARGGHPYEGQCRPLQDNLIGFCLRVVAIKLCNVNF